MLAISAAYKIVFYSAFVARARVRRLILCLLIGWSYHKAMAAALSVKYLGNFASRLELEV